MSYCTASQSLCSLSEEKFKCHFRCRMYKSYNCFKMLFLNCLLVVRIGLNLETARCCFVDPEYDVKNTSSKNVIMTNSSKNILRIKRLWFNPPSREMKNCLKRRLFIFFCFFQMSFPILQWWVEREWDRYTNLTQTWFFTSDKAREMFFYDPNNGFISQGKTWDKRGCI